MQIFKTMEKSEFCVLIFWWEKMQFKQSNGLISVIWTLLRRKQWLRGGMLTLNAVVQAQMMLNAQVTQIQQLSWKTTKNSKLILADHKLKLLWDSKQVEDIRRQCIHHFAWTFVNEKAVFKMDAMFAHSRSKTTMHPWFRALFATVSMQQKGVFP